MIEHVNNGARDKQATQGALQGIKVIDLSRVLGGPTAHRRWPITAPRSSSWSPPAATKPRLGAAVLR
jgi:hypothetical protein